MDILKLDPFPSIAASSPFSLSTREIAGRTVYAVFFELGGTFTKAQITSLRIRAGQKDVLPKIDGDQLQTINDYQGLTADANYLFHWFCDPLATSVRGEWLGGLDLSIYGSDPLEIRGDVGAATAPTLQAWAIVGPPKTALGYAFSDAEAHWSRVLVPTVLQPAASVTRQSASIGLGSQAGGRIRQISFLHSNLTSVEFRKNANILWEDLPVALVNAVENSFARSNQTGLYVVDRIVNGAQGEAETTLQPDGTPWPMQVLISTSASDTINVYADLHAPLALI